MMCQVSDMGDASDLARMPPRMHVLKVRPDL